MKRRPSRRLSDVYAMINSWDPWESWWELRRARYESLCQEISPKFSDCSFPSRDFSSSDTNERSRFLSSFFLLLLCLPLPREFGGFPFRVKNRAFRDPFARTTRYAQSIRRRCIPLSSSHRPAHPRKRGIRNSKRSLNSSGSIGRDLRICRRARTHVEPVCVPACNVTRCLLRVYRG